MVILFKTVIVLLLLFIVVSLARAGIAMIKGGDKPMTHYLGRRVALSALVLLLLVLAVAFGLISTNPRPY